jgi:hypothetical protein
MFWIGVGVAVLVLLGLTWMGARLFHATAPRHDREDTPLIPGPDHDDDPLI